LDEPLYPLDLDSPKSTAPLEPDRVKPELRHVVVTLHMDVGWFMSVASVEQEPVRAKTQYGWHEVNIPEAGGR
jgi:hypothetical protein